MGFNELLTNDDCVGTPPPTKKRSSRPLVANSLSNTPASEAPSPNVPTLARNCRVSKPTDPSNWLSAELNDEPRPFLELFLLKNRNWLPRSPSNLERPLLRLLRKKLPRLLRSLRNPRVRSK